MGKEYSPIKKKILLLLSVGIELSFNTSPLGHIKAWKRFGREWKSIKEEELRKAIRDFYRKNLIDFKKNNDGTQSVVITKKGRKKVEKYKLDNLNIKKPLKWDKKWRLVVFDIPETKRVARDVFRKKIKSIGFLEMQKSVWIYPYDCEDLIDFIVNFYKINQHVNYMVIDKLKNDKKIKAFFKL